jgi:hypothetical protein
VLERSNANGYPVGHVPDGLQKPLDIRLTSGAGWIDRQDETKAQARIPLDITATLIFCSPASIMARYYVVVEQPDAKSWRWGWEIYRDGKVLPVRLS